MRNLKRALSLTLASVMLLGMMVVGSSAAAGYDDVADTDNVEAIEVLQAVEVMVGDERGFGPERPVNRAEMAVVMGKLLNLDYNYYEATCPFNDVYDWARGWVGACYANGIVSGRGEGVYDPGTTVTAVEAASMLMRALGYFKYQSDYASGFEVSTVLQANKIRLFDGVNSKTNEPLTRNQVAQMALNALKSGMVEPDGNALNFIDASGNVIATGGKVNYVYVTSNKSFATAIDDVKASSMGSANDSPIVELGEQLYDGKLKLDDGALDAFGRPSRKWELDGKAIGTYTKRELMVMDNVGKVTGNDLYTLLGASTIKDYDVLVTIDGVDNKRTDAKAILGEKVFTEAVDMNRNNKAEIGGTGTGVLTQVFVDHEDDEVYVAIINTYLARASRDYDDKSEEANLTVYSIDKHNASGEYFKVAKSTKDSEAMKIQNEDFDLAKDIKKDDAFLVQIAEGEIKTIEPAEVLEAATLSAFKLGDKVVSGGTDYNYTTTVGYKDGDLDAYTGGDITNLKDRTYNIFLDAYSNLIGLEEVDGAKNYVFLAGIDLDGSNLYNKNATANALFLDGTSKTIKINMAKSVFRNGDLSNTNIVIDGDALLNTWCTYTVSGDVYTVKEVYSTNVDEGNYPQPTVSGAKNTSKLAQYHQTSMPVDNKVDVKRMRLWGATSRTNQFANVYGDSDSVYLTTELSELRNTGEGNDGLSTKLSYGIIKGVDALTTGIADTNITVWTKTQARNEAEKTDLIRDQKVNPSKVDGMTGSDTDNIDNVAYGIYTLYDDEGIIIAAVVVGENEGVKDMVYVHSDVPELESDNGGSAKAADDGLWTWTRKVIRDGQEVTLTEVGDSLDYLGKDQMRQYQWYEIKTNADGEVIDATPAWSALGCYRVDDVTAPIDPKGDVNKDGYFVDLYEDINFRVEDSSKDTVLYQTAGGPVNYANDPACHQHANGGFVKQQLEVKGNNTLAVTTEEGSGIHFRNDVNVVLQYWNQNTKKEEIETGTGADRLKSMVDFVNDNTKAGRGNDEPYYVSALIEKGFATTIVIYDSFNNYNRPEADVKYIDMKPTSTIADVNEALIDNNVRITGAWQPNDLVAEDRDRLNTVKIPNGRTLYIDGNFIGFENGTSGKGSIYVTAGGESSKMIVNGDAYLAGQQLDCDTTVYGDLEINTAPDSKGITYLNADFDVRGDLIVRNGNNGNGKNVRVTSGSNVIVTGDLDSKVSDLIITVYGHLEFNSDEESTYPVHYHVLSTNTLKVKTLTGTFCVGSGRTAGRVEVNDLSTKGSIPADCTCGSVSGVNLQNGTLVINRYTNIDEVQVYAKYSPVIVFGTGAKTNGGIFVTESGEIADVGGKTYTFSEDKNGYVAISDGKTTIPSTIPSDGVVMEVPVDEKPIEPEKTYKVTVAETENGTVKADKTSAAEGTTVTVTAEPAEGYKLSSVATDPRTTVTIKGNEATFKMPAKDTIVTVTFKAEPPVTGVYTLKFGKEITTENSKVTLNGTALADGAEVQAADISKLVVKPAGAVELKTDNTAKTITVQPIDGFHWTDAWSGLWMKNDNGDLIMIPGAVASVARFSLTRAASARVSDGQQDADTWIETMIQDLRDNPTAKWEVKNADGKTIWVAQKYGGGVKLVKAEGVTKEEANAAFENIETCTIWRTADGTATDTVKLTVNFRGAYTVVANGVKVGNVVKKAETLVSGQAYDVVKNTDVVLTISQASRGYTVSVSNATKGTKADANGIIPWTVKVTDADVTAEITATKRDEKTAYDLTAVLNSATDWDSNWTVKVQGENDKGVEYVSAASGLVTGLAEGAGTTKTLKNIFPGETVTISKGTVTSAMAVKDLTIDGVKIKGVNNGPGTNVKYTFTMPDKDLFGFALDANSNLKGLNDAAPTETVTVKNNAGITYTYADANDATKTITVTGEDERDLPVNTKITITNAGATGEVITAKAGVDDSTSILGSGVYTAEDDENEITVAGPTELYSAVKVTAGTGVTLKDNTTGGAIFAAGNTKWIPVNTELMVGTAAYAAKYTGKTAPASFETAAAKAGLLTADADCTVIEVTPVVVGKNVKATFGTETKSYTDKTVYAVTGTAVKVSADKADCVVVKPTSALSYAAGITETTVAAGDKLSVASKVTFEQVAAMTLATPFKVNAAGTAMDAAGTAVDPAVGTMSGLNATGKAGKVISYILPGTHVHVAGAAGDTVTFTGAATADDAKGNGFATYTIGTGAVGFKSQTNTNRYDTLENALGALTELNSPTAEVILTKDAEIKASTPITNGKLILDEGVTLTISGASTALSGSGTIEGWGNVVIDGVTTTFDAVKITTSGTITLINGAKADNVNGASEVIIPDGENVEIDAADALTIAKLTVNGTLSLKGGAALTANAMTFGEDGKVVINASGAGLTLGSGVTEIGNIDITVGTLTLGANTKLEAGKTINVDLNAATKGIIDFASKDLTGGKDSKIVVTGTGATTNILNYASHECFYIGGAKETTETNIVAGTYTWTEGMGGSNNGFNKPA